MNGIIIFILMNDGSFVTCKKIEINDKSETIRIDDDKFIDATMIEGIKMSTFEEVRARLFPKES